MMVTKSAERKLNITFSKKIIVHRCTRLFSTISTFLKIAKLRHNKRNFLFSLTELLSKNGAVTEKARWQILVSVLLGFHLAQN